MVDGWAGAASDERDRLQRQARALGSPTRFAIFEHVAKAGAPVRVAALVDRFELNHNAVRQHLAKLCEADLLVEEFATRNGPGRPALQYRLATDVAGTWGTASPYERLAAVLLEMAADGLSPREAGRRAGRRGGASATATRADPLERLMAELAGEGFSPRVVHGSTGTDILLDSCPFPAAAAAHPEVVWELQRGLIEGFLEAQDADLEVTDLHVEEGGRPVCTLRVRRSAPG